MQHKLDITHAETVSSRLHVTAVFDITLCSSILLKFLYLCTLGTPGTLTLRPERQSARMSKITNDGLTRSGTGRLIAVLIWQQWASKV